MATKKWVIDPAHSEVQFKVKHLMISTVTGTFGKVSGSVESDDDNFSGAKIVFTADVDSVTTGAADRDNHLKSGDFFDAAQYPEIKFVSTSFKTSGSGDYELSGDLTIHGVTKNIKLDVEFGGVAKDPWGNTKAGFTIQGKISRKEFGLTWNTVTEAGGVLVSDDVRIACEIQLAPQA